MPRIAPKAPDRQTNGNNAAKFVLDGEAIQHSKELASTLRYRNFYQRSLVIEVLEQSGRKIHEEVVYPKDELRT